MTAISDYSGGLLEDNDPGRVCKDCGFTNPSAEEYCLACNSDLGRVDRFAEATATGRYHDIRLACEQVRSGGLGLGEFARFLEGISNTLAQKSREILDTIEACNYWQDGADEIEMGLMGVQSYEEGLAEIWQFTHDTDPDHLENGLIKVWEGNQRIIEAMRINRESRQLLALEWELLQGGG